MPRVNAPAFQENYFPTRLAVPASDVVGRRDYIRNLVFDLSSGENVVVVGPRRVGKSSVVNRAVSDLEKAGKTKVLTVNFGSVVAGDQFVQVVTDQLAPVVGVQPGWFAKLKSAGASQRTTSLMGKLGPLGQAGVALVEEASVGRRVAGALGLVTEFALLKGSPRVVVVLDEFQDSAAVDPKFESLVRGEADRAKGRVSFAFLGSAPTMMRQAFSDRRRPLYRAGQSRPMPDAEVAEWAEYLESKFAAARIRCRGRTLDALLEGSAPHAQNTMATAYHLYRMCCLNGITDPGLEEVRDAVAVAAESLADIFVGEWDRFDAGERTVLGQVARRLDVYEHVSLDHRQRNARQRALKRLTEDGVLLHGQGRGRYEFREPMFDRFVQDRLGGSR